MRNLFDDNPTRLNLEWQGLTLARLFLVYRMLLAIALGALYFFDLGPSNLGSHAPVLYANVVSFYMALTGLALVLSVSEFWDAESSNHLAVFVDIPVIGLLMYSSGGVVSGLGTLTAISIAMGSLGFSGRIALLYAAMATLAVITEQVYAHLQHEFSQTAYTHAAGLGLAFFAIAILAHFLTARLYATEQKVDRQETAITDLSQLSDYVIHQMDTGVLMVDSDHRVHRSNRSARELLGFPKAELGESLHRFSVRLSQVLDDWKVQGQWARRRVPFTTEDRALLVTFLPIGHEGRSGTLLFLEDSSRIAEQAQSMKLASLGQLTASIAHEIRNPLGAMSHAAQLMEESEALSPEDQRMVEIINDNSKRINRIVESVMRLSRRTSPNPQLIPLEPLLCEMKKEIGDMYGLQEQQFDCSIEPPDLAVTADRDQFIQVIRILVDNSARHFDRERSMLCLTFRAHLDARKATPVLQIADNGPGISEGASQRIFEPFFYYAESGYRTGFVHRS